MAETLLKVSGVSKHFGGFTALSEVSIAIAGGERFGLIGPNGSGKTTLFECIGGVLPFDAGAVDRSESLFYLPDGIAPWPSETLSWSLDFASGLFGAPSGLRATVIDALSLGPLLDKRIGHLSKGQRKRALLAIGLLTARPTLLADEPFDGLDLRQTREVADALRAFARAGRTLVLSIHQIADAARVCDRFVLLSNGTIRGEGTLGEITSLASQRQGKAIDGLEEAFLALT
jgi:ABC-2 type transport system ATP-binding protein